MTPKILITNSYPVKIRRIIEFLKPAGFDLLYVEEPTKAALLSLCDQVEYLLIGGRIPIDDEVLKRANKLKMIQRTGVGLDQVDIEALRRYRIPLYVNKGVNAISVAEHSLMLLLSLLRRLKMADGLLREGIWKKQDLGIDTYELNGKTIGLIGLGNIGLHFAKILQPFGVTICYHKPTRLSESIEKEYGLSFVDLEELLTSSDIISLHCSLEVSTIGLINSDTISKMRDRVFIINTSRGKLINEKDLVEGLITGKIGGAALDVFEEEPLSASHPLLQLDNVLLTPHIGGVTYESFSRMYIKAFENIAAYELQYLSKIEALKVV